MPACRRRICDILKKILNFLAIGVAHESFKLPRAGREVVTGGGIVVGGAGVVGGGFFSSSTSFSTALSRSVS